MLNEEVLVSAEHTNEYYPIFIYPSEKLREKAVAVTDFGPEFQKVVEKLARSMYKAGGVGIAANQAGLPFHLFLVDVSTDKNDLRIFVNAKIVSEAPKVAGLEGCLSFPGVLEKVSRAETIIVDAQDQYGNPFTREYSGIEAVAIQHELDHLNGVLLWDKVSRLKQKFIKKTITNFMNKIERMR